MRYLFFLFVALQASDVIGQKNPALMEVVNAEKSFASHARSTSISEAFMKFLDDSARVFEKGEIVNGKATWGSRKTDSADLAWYPEFAEVAASGDFGYTTGPSQFRLKKGSAEPDYRGYFSSIWLKNKSGGWKVILDIGCQSPSEFDESKVDYTNKASLKDKRPQPGKTNIKSVEESFIASCDEGNGYLKYGSTAGRYYRPGQKAVKGDFSPSDTVKITFKNAGTGMAPSGDFGYAYGYATASQKKGNYLRVWKKESDGWKIVLDVTTY